MVWEKNEETRGEALIKDFLEEKGIEAKQSYKIPNLQTDIKNFREADFYIPKYDVYLEFLGQWNVPNEKTRYKQKMRVYYKNNIPCIYIWPDNLGTLEWMFKRRMREVLLRYNKNKHLLKYEFYNFWEDKSLPFLLLLVIVWFLRDSIMGLLIGVILLFSFMNYIRTTHKKLKKIKASKWVSRNK